MISLVPLLVIQAAVGQSVPDQGIFGDFLVVPGDRFGVLRLGQNRQDVTSRLGTSSPVPPANYPYGWDWPERGFGVVEAWQAEAARIGFCRSNDRVFFASGSFVNASVPNQPITSARLARVRTPEGLTVYSQLTDFARAYGDPVATLRNMGGTRLLLLLYANGLVVNSDGQRAILLGAFNPDICTKGHSSGVYIPFVGRAEIKRSVTSKTGDERQGIVGEPATLFKKDDRVYFLLELSFSAPNTNRKVPLTRRFIQPDGNVYDVRSDERIVQAGETSQIWVFWLGKNPPRPAGKWKLELSSRGVLVTTIEFESTD